MKTIQLKCQCQSKAIEIQYDKEDTDGDYYVSLWKLGGYRSPMSFKERLRWAWHILKTGTPWADEVILNSEQMDELQSFITSCKEDTTPKPSGKRLILG